MISPTPAPTVAAPRRTAVRGILLVLGLAVALLFVAHGLAHVVGFAGTWGFSESAAIGDGSTLLAGLDPDGIAMHALGLLWLVPIPVFLAAAVGLVARRTWWWGWALVATVASLVLCVLWFEPARIGLALNVVILAGLAVVAVLRRRAGR